MKYGKGVQKKREQKKPKTCVDIIYGRCLRPTALLAPRRQAAAAAAATRPPPLSLLRVVRPPSDFQLAFVIRLLRGSRTRRYVDGLSPPDEIMMAPRGEINGVAWRK